MTSYASAWRPCAASDSAQAAKIRRRRSGEDSWRADPRRVGPGGLGLVGPARRAQRLGAGDPGADLVVRRARAPPRAPAPGRSSRERLVVAPRGRGGSSPGYRGSGRASGSGAAAPRSRPPRAASSSGAPEVAEPHERHRQRVLELRLLDLLLRRPEQRERLGRRPDRALGVVGLEARLRQGVEVDAALAEVETARRARALPRGTARRAPGRRARSRPGPARSAPGPRSRDPRRPSGPSQGARAAADAPRRDRRAPCGHRRASTGRASGPPAGRCPSRSEIASIEQRRRPPARDAACTGLGRAEQQLPAGTRRSVAAAARSS